MGGSVKRYCPYCGAEIALEAFMCLDCGRDLREMKIARSRSEDSKLYHVVPDGSNFGIAIAGEIKIHGLDYQKAERLAAILNSAVSMGNAGC